MKVSPGEHLILAVSGLTADNNVVSTPEYQCRRYRASRCPAVRIFQIGGRPPADPRECAPTGCAHASMVGAVCAAPMTGTSEISLAQRRSGGVWWGTRPRLQRISRPQCSGRVLEDPRRPGGLPHGLNHCRAADSMFSAISNSFRTVFQLRLVPLVCSVFSTCASDSFGRAMPLV